MENLQFVLKKMASFIIIYIKGVLWVKMASRNNVNILYHVHIFFIARNLIHWIESGLRFIFEINISI